MDFEQLIQSLRSQATKLRTEGTLYTAAKLLDDAADALIAIKNDKDEAESLLRHYMDKYESEHKNGPTD